MLNLVGNKIVLRRKSGTIANNPIPLLHRVFKYSLPVVIKQYRGPFSELPNYPTLNIPIGVLPSEQQDGYREKMSWGIS